MKGTFAPALATFLAITGNGLAHQLPTSPGAIVPSPAAPKQLHLSPHRFVADELIVRFKKGTPGAAMAAAHAQVGAKEMHRFASVEGLARVKIPAGMSVPVALERYRKRPDIMYVQPNYYNRAQAVPNDPYFADGSLWGLQNTGQAGGTPGDDIHAPAAWDLTTGNRDVVVMVIDSGIDYNHPDLKANMWPTYGINTVYQTSDPMDDTVDSHGTHVAGIIGAVGNNALGVVGVAWQISLMACKAFDSTENGTDADIIACLDYAQTMKQRGVNIVATNNSYGGAPFDPALHDAILAQMQQGILFITTAGDVAMDEELGEFYPANYDLPNIITVAATDRNDNLWPYSGYGAHEVHLGAPGVDIYGTLRGSGYDVASGTSEATAYVTGVVALLKAQDPNRDWRAIKNLILAGGDDDAALRNILVNTITGKRLNAFGSLTCQNSTVLSRFRPKGDGSVPVGVPMGTTVGLSVLNINCAAPNGPVGVTVQPGNSVIPLVDDGTGNDYAAGDGVYSANWNPPGPGAYILTFPGGDVWQASVLPAYTYRIVPFNWQTIDGTNLNLSDDSTASVASDFPVTLGAASFSSVYVDSNGKVNFSFPETDYANVSLPNPYAGYSFMVAPWWDDLNPIQNTAQNVFSAVTGAAPQRQLVIEWRNVSRASGCTDPTANVTFQAVFFEGSSDVLFNYAHTAFGGPPACAAGDNGAQATVGIQIVDPSAAQFSFDTPSLTDNMSIRFSLVQ